MTDAEKVLHFQDLEERTQIAESEVNRLKDLLNTAKKHYDAAVIELRSAIRRHDDDHQIELDLKKGGSVEVIDESHQLPEHPPSTLGDGTQEPTLPENPSTADPADQDRFQDPGEKGEGPDPDGADEDDGSDDDEHEDTVQPAQTSLPDGTYAEGPKLTEEMKAAAARTRRFGEKGSRNHAA